MDTNQHGMKAFTPDLTDPPCGAAPANICRRRQAETGLLQTHGELAARVRHLTREIAELNERVMHETNTRSIAEENLHRSQQMFHLLLDNIPQRVFWKDRDSSYLGCNRQFAEHVGLDDTGDITGMNDHQMPWSIKSEYFQAADLMIMEFATPMRNYDVPQPAPDGRLAWQRMSKLPLYSRNGAVIGVLGIFEDITEKMRIRDSLIKNEHILAEAQAIAHLGSWEYCLETQKEYRSAEFFRILGHPQQTSGVAADSMFDYIHPQDRERVRQRLTRTLENGKPYDIEYRIIRADGQERFVHAKGKTIREENDKSTRFIGAIQDITERKRAEEHRRRQWEQLAALRAIDMAITESSDLRVTLNVVLDQHSTPPWRRFVRE